MQKIGACIQKHAPPWVLSLFFVRVLIALLATVIPAWWLVGFSYLRPLRVRPLPSDPTSAADSEESPSARQTNVEVMIPDCGFLRQARETFGKAGGDNACVNE